MPTPKPATEPQEAPEHYPIRRRCKNCPIFFTIESARAKHKRFHSANCRREFFRFGSSYGALKEQIEKLIAAGIKQATDSERIIEAIKAAGFIHRSQLRKIEAAKTRDAITRRLDEHARIIEELSIKAGMLDDSQSALFAAYVRSR